MMKIIEMRTREAGFFPMEAMVATPRYSFAAVTTQYIHLYTSSFSLRFTS
jgi:hypothetical protein